MKKFMMIIIGAVLCLNLSVASPFVYVSDMIFKIEGQDVVFRSLQKMRSNDGREIYFYSNRKCEMYNGDCLVVTTTYRLIDGEVFLLDENGNTVYKGSYRMSSDGYNLRSVTIAGTTYYRK